MLASLFPCFLASLFTCLLTYLFITTETFSKHLLNIGEGKVALYENTECIKLPNDLYTIINSQINLIDQIFPDIHTILEP